MITKQLESRLPAILADLAGDAAFQSTQARERGEKEEAKYFQRLANAYARAAVAWQDGIRPTDMGNGKYLLPSRSDDIPHIVSMDGDWTCTCRAGSSAHWATCLMIAVERANELLELEDAADEAPLYSDADFERDMAASLW